MDVVIAGTDEGAIPLALKLSAAGFRVGFYSPNPHISSLLEKHEGKTHYPLTRQEHIRLLASGQLQRLDTPSTDVEELYVYVNTLKNGVNRFADAENLVRELADKTGKISQLVLAGITKPGEALTLMELFNKRHGVLKHSTGFLGAPHTKIGRPPSWTAGAPHPKTFSKLSTQPFRELEQAEHASILLTAAEALHRVAAAHNNMLLKTELTNELLGDGLFIRSESLDVLSYLSRLERVDEGSPKLYTYVLSSLRRAVERVEQEVLKEVKDMVRGSRRQVRVAVVSCDESYAKKIAATLSRAKIKTAYVNVDNLKARGQETFRGFKAAVLASNEIYLMAELEKVCEKAWYIPSLGELS